MMNKFTMVLGAAAVVTIAGCKDPDYVRGGSATQNDVKNVDTAVVEAPNPIVVSKPIEPVAATPIVAEPVAPAKAKPAEPDFTIYIVQSGDYLAKVSKKFNVTISSIKRLNPSIKNDMIRIGQKLKLPGKVDVGVQAEPSKVAKSAKPVAKVVKKGYLPYKGETQEYVVKSGDTLGSVAYGNGCNIRQLKELNGITKDTLRIGQKLKVPANGVARKSAAVKAETKVAAPVVEKKVVETSKTALPAAAVAPVAPVADAPATEAPTVAAPTPAATAAVVPAAPATTTYVVQEGDDITGVSIRWGVSAAEIRELNNLGEGDQLVPGKTIRLPADAQQ